MIIPEIYYDLTSLFLMAFLVFTIGSIILISYSKKILVSLIVSFIKSSLFLMYYLYFFNKTDFTLIDSLVYIDNTNLLVNSIPLQSFFDNLNQFYVAAGGTHIGYYIYSYFLCKIFGTFYFVPVAFNIIITFIAAYLVYKIGLLITLSRRLSIYLSIFYVLHWDTISWSTFNNIRDIIISTLIIFSLYCIIKLSNKVTTLDLFLLFICLYILHYFRFYIVVFLLGTLLFYFLLVYSKKYKYIRISKQLLIQFKYIIYLIMVIGLAIFYYFYEMSFYNWLIDAVNPLYGVPRFLLTPIPFYELYNGYGYLHFAALLHWIFIPLFFYGWLHLYSINKKVFLVFTIYLLAVLCFFGVYAPVQGPRHRLNTSLIIIIFQYIGFVFYYKRYLLEKNSNIN